MRNQPSRISVTVCALLFFALAAQAQTVAPIGGLGNIQFLDNNGAPLTAGVLYSYQAGTSTPQATFTDSSGLTQNPNPTPFGSGARVQIWLSIGSFYKFVLCSQNDGAACAAGDILLSVDQVPGGATSSGGSSSSPFISSTANPATSGILRLATSDTICFRNAAGSTNLCFSKDANDALTWPTALKMPEISAPSCAAGFDYIWADSTNHGFTECANGGSAVKLAFAGNDLNANSQVTQLHFGATATPLSGTAPTTNQYLQWNGANIVGGVVESTMSNATQIGSNPPCAAANPTCLVFIFVNAHTLTRLVTNTSTLPTGCSTNAAFGLKDLTSSSVVAALTPTTTGILDSGPLSAAMTAGHQFGLGVTTQGIGCGPFVQANVTATYN